MKRYRCWPEGREELGVLVNDSFETLTPTELAIRGATKLWPFDVSAPDPVKFGLHNYEDEITKKPYTIWFFHHTPTDMGQITLYLSDDLESTKLLSERKWFPELFEQFPEDRDESGAGGAAV